MHGFASSGQNGSVKTLRLLMPQAEVIAPDLPVEPFEAMNLLRNMMESEKPDLIIGTSMGAMYAEMLYGVDRILVNPAFQLADTLLKTTVWEDRNIITLVRTVRRHSWSRKPFWNISVRSARIVSRGRLRIRTRSSGFTESTTRSSTLSTCSVSIILRR